MVKWLKDKILGNFGRWLSEKRARAYQAMHTRRMQGIIKKLPQELREVNRALEILNNNSWAVHHLFKRARGKKQHANAFLYFFYSFELTLKHLIISEMHLKNAQNILTSHLRQRRNFFSIYSEKEMVDILVLGPTGKVIEKFLKIFQNSSIENDLWKINKERTIIIHDISKREMSEEDIEHSFQSFFKKTNSEILNTFQVFDSILAGRPKDILQKLTRFMLDTD